VYCARPEFLSPDASEVYRGAAVHAGRCVGAADGFERIGGNHSHSCRLPGIFRRRRWMLMVVGMRVVVVRMFMAVGVRSFDVSWSWMF
jgi:hypothetical protein